MGYLHYVIPKSTWVWSNKVPRERIWICAFCGKRTEGHHTSSSEVWHNSWDNCYYKKSLWGLWDITWRKIRVGNRITCGGLDLSEIALISICGLGLIAALITMLKG